MKKQTGLFPGKDNYQWTQKPLQNTAWDSACCCQWPGAACSWTCLSRNGTGAGGWSRWWCSQCSSSAFSPSPEHRARFQGRGRAGWGWAQRSRCLAWWGWTEVARGAQQRHRPLLPPRGTLAAGGSCRRGFRGSAWNRWVLLGRETKRILWLDTPRFLQSTQRGHEGWSWPYCPQHQRNSVTGLSTARVAWISSRHCPPPVADGAKERAQDKHASVQHQPAGAASPTGLSSKEGVFPRKKTSPRLGAKGLSAH